MLSKELSHLNMAFKEAREQRHESAVEHLLALIDNPAAKVLRARGADLAQLRRHSPTSSTSSPLLPDDEDRDAADARLPAGAAARGVPRPSSGKKEVNGANVLVAIFGERESHAVYLNQQNIARLDVVNCISHGISKVNDEDGNEESSAPAEEEAEPGENSTTPSPPSPPTSTSRRRPARSIP